MNIFKESIELVERQTQGQNACLACAWPWVLSSVLWGGGEKEKKQGT